MNRVELIGGLLRDPTLRYIESTGVALAEFQLAVSGARYDREAHTQVVTTAYVGCQVWAEAAERFAEQAYLKGDELYVLGRLVQQEVEKGEGKTETKTRVAVLWWQLVRRHRARAG